MRDNVRQSIEMSVPDYVDFKFEGTSMARVMRDIGRMTDANTAAERESLLSTGAMPADQVRKIDASIRSEEKKTAKKILLLGAEQVDRLASADPIMSQRIIDDFIGAQDIVSEESFLHQGISDIRTLVRLQTRDFFANEFASQFLSRGFITWQEYEEVRLHTIQMMHAVLSPIPALEN